MLIQNNWSEGHSTLSTAFFQRFLRHGIILEQPERRVFPPSWLGHIPFAFWLMDTLRPRVFVELGTHAGNSYCAFCQAVDRLQLNSTGYAIDNWRGDAHSGFYGDEVFEDLSDYHDRRYGGFSRLVRTTFDAAAGKLSDESIDLLHIDGCHTYKSVKHDLERWLPKLSSRSIILLHDTNVLEEDFGVKRFWEETSAGNPHFEFHHSHGLGVLARGNDLPEPVAWLVDRNRSPEEQYQIRALFSVLGNSVNEAYERSCLKAEAEQQRAKIGELTRELSSARAEVSGIRAKFEDVSGESVRLVAASRESQQRLWDSEREMASLRESLLAERDRRHAAEESVSKLEQRRGVEIEAATRELREALSKASEEKERVHREMSARLIADVERLKVCHATEMAEVRESWWWKAGQPARNVAEAAGGLFRDLVEHAVRLRLRFSPAHRATCAKLRSSGLFNEEFYQRRYPDVASSSLSALDHFVAFGAVEGRDPHPLFSTNFYVDRYPEAKARRDTPLSDFLEAGTRHRRNPHPLFDTGCYVDCHPELESADDNALAHYLRTGAQNGENPHPMFSTTHYLAQDPSLAKHGINPLWHYVCQGDQEGRDPHPLFSHAFYVARNPEIVRDKLNPLVHYIHHYQDEDCPANPYRLDPLSRRMHDWLRAHVAVGDGRELAAELVFEGPEEPEISVVIPAHNKVRWTLRCLQAVRDSAAGLNCEVIVVDDASTDESGELLGAIPGIRYVRNESNIGFLKSCNAGAGLAKGAHIVLLNNDTIPMPGWLENLIRTFEEFPGAGMAGSRLLYADGRLQEAGGVIWPDGSGWNYGRTDTPEKPEYSYARRTDYCSGASIMLPRAVWNELGGFDEEFAPAYYEDTDLSFRLRRSGYDVVYQPFSEVIHFEGTSSGTSVDSGVKRYQEVNRKKFQARWREVIASHGAPEGGGGFFRARYCPLNALVLDACTPTPDRDSGSNDALHYLMILKSLGYHVTFLPADNMIHWGPYTKALQRAGIECIYKPFVDSAAEFIRDEGRKYDLALVFREPIASRYLGLLRAHASRSKVIFHTVDLHHLREARIAEHTNDPGLARQAELTEVRELETIRAADHSIVVSEHEKEILARKCPDARVSVIPLGREIHGRKGAFEARRDIVFLGAFTHPPNLDAARFFVKDIWPAISRKLPGVRFLLVGSGAGNEIRELTGEYVELVGHVQDLSGVFDHCRISVAPVRFGAGMKGKVVTSLSYGVPCVATGIAAEGTSLVNGRHILVADTPEEFAARVIEIYTSPERWERISRNGLSVARERFSLESVETAFSGILAEQGLLPEAEPSGAAAEAGEGDSKPEAARSGAISG